MSDIKDNIRKMNDLVSRIEDLKRRKKEIEKYKNGKSVFRINERYHNFDNNTHSTIKRILIADINSNITKLENKLKQLYNLR